MKIESSVALITGGASGLGEATVRRIVARGGRALIVDIQEKGETLVTEMGNNNVLFCKADVTKEEEINKAIKLAMDSFGAINLLVNCAGVGNPGKLLGKKGPMTLDFFNWVVGTNLVGTFNVIRLAVEKMVTGSTNEFGEKGIIINTASVAAFDGQIGQPAYSASKAGVVGMTLPMARELASYGIRVVTIAPGIFNTPMLGVLPEESKTALGKMVPFPPRLGCPEEYAMLVEHIVENVMLNGECIRLDGAIRMAPK
jgi:NAD(P)-dependent dehydrogenase (short-subunit alcohol dehydrogenase family)